MIAVTVVSGWGGNNRVVVAGGYGVLFLFCFCWESITR